MDNLNNIKFENFNFLKLNHKKIIWGLLVLAAIFCAFGMASRLAFERNSDKVGMVLDYRDLVSLARETGLSLDSTWDKMFSLGISGLSVSEFTGKELASGLLAVTLSPVSSVTGELKLPAGMPNDRAVLWGDVASPAWRLLIPYILIKFPQTFTVSGGKLQGLVLPVSFYEIQDSGIAPDILGLGFAERRKIPAIFRPYPCVGADGAKVADALRILLEAYPQIKCVLPGGVIVPGYPDTAPLVALLKEKNISVAQVEFVKQAGLAELIARASPAVLPLHSLVRDEVLTRNITVGQTVERMVRAVHERSVRLLLVRPYDIYTGKRADIFIATIEELGSALTARAYSLEWPHHMTNFGRSFFAALGMAIAFFALSLALFLRFYPQYNNILLKNKTMLILFSIAVLILAALLYFVPIFGRYIGGFFGAFAAAEATLCALDDRKNCFWGALEGLLLILAAGLCIAAFYGVPEYMLRLRGFSGVKLTLLLPPLLVLLHDLKRRVYPEELKEVLSRPPLWGELIVLGVLMGAVLFMAVRSDNTALVPAWEIALRENLERLLRVRPRTKEFLVGYPSLLLWYVAKKRDLIPRYREIFRLCASIGFASAINTFCHLHTQFFLTVIRTINGWWAGMLIGTVLAVAVNLIWQSRHKQDRQSAITQPSM